jgi:hypothetical protein
LLTLIWYLDRKETNPTLVCISPNRIPEKISNSLFRMGVSTEVIMCYIVQLASQVGNYTESLKVLSLTTHIWDYDGLQKTYTTLMSV